MKKYFFIILLFSNLIFSQSPAGIWYFGKNAGLDFNSGTNPVALLDGALNTYEGCSTLCDNFGNLLFYTDGIKVFNKSHIKMQNGFGLNGDSSSTQSAVIIPKPNNQNLYYIFTIDELGKPNGLNYSIVDMTLDNGFGDITTKNVQLLSSTLEKVNAVKHFNENDYWLITHKYQSDKFYTYKITQNGILQPIIASVGDVVDNGLQSTLGYLKSSPNGKYLASANSSLGSSKVQLFKFNNTNGAITLIASIQLQNGDQGIGVYGVEFSNDSNLLYISNIDIENKKSQIYQYDIQSENEALINSTSYLVSESISTQQNDNLYGALQLAPNKKIYITRNNISTLAVINSPDEIGANCQFSSNGVDLGGRKSYFGLPLFVASLFDISFINKNNCFGNLTQFEIPTIPNILSVSWDFGDPTSANNTSSLQNPTHQFTSQGVFIVTLTVVTNLRTTSFQRQVTIVNAPVANQATNIVNCYDDSVSTITVNLLASKNEVLGLQSPNDYNVTFYTSSQDAQNQVNSISYNYVNNQVNQLLFARVQPLNSSDCYDISSFNLIFNSQPTLADDKTIHYCKDKFPNTITISAENQNPSENLTYSWSNGATTESITINQAGVFTVTATNSSNCVATRTITVLNSEIASITSIVSGQIGDNYVIVNATGTGSYLYSMDQEFGPYQYSSTFNNVSPGEHIFYVKDENNCGIIKASFSILGYPKFFTPNGDGFNDFWQLQGKNIGIKSLRIFDRYGKLLEDVTLKIGWNGKYNGVNAIATDYWFIAELDSGEKVRGHFSLIR